MNDTRKCKNCGEKMLEIGAIGREVQETDWKGVLIGIRPMKLYQCIECKDVEIY